jgi:hypothetical protein
MKNNGNNGNNSNNVFLDCSKKPNRFTFLGANEDTNQSYNFDKQRDNMRERERSNNIFLTNKSNAVNKSHHVSRTPSLISKSNKFSNIKTNCDLTDADFPELCIQPIKQVEQNTNENYSFKTAINVSNNDVNITINSENNIEPGWVQIQTVNKQIVFKYGHTTINNNDDEHTQKYVEHNMNNAIATMSTNWDKYRTNYDELNGEGSYDDVYYLSQNYEDTVSETEPELDNDSEYSDTNY